MSEAMAERRGQCLCGAVRFRLQGKLRDVVLCHCAMCRRWHGHVAAYTNVPRAKLAFDEARGLAWFDSSDIARRGFCRDCGSSLFWERRGGETVSVTAGCLDMPTGLTTTSQIHVADKGDCYLVDERVPQRTTT